jgi:hypothetical protein
MVLVIEMISGLTCTQRRPKVFVSQLDKHPSSTVALEQEMVCYVERLNLRTACHVERGVFATIKNDDILYLFQKKNEDPKEVTKTN